MSLKSLLKTVLISAVTVIILLALANIITFLNSRELVPPATTMSGVDISNLSIREAISRTGRMLQSPIALRYREAIIQLNPQQVDFQLNEVVAELQLDQLVNSRRGIEQLPDFVMRRTAETALNAPYLYSEVKLTEVLGQIAAEYDRAPSAAQPDASTLVMSAKQDGNMLNVEEARLLIVNALSTSSPRFVDLPVDIIPGDETSLLSLTELIKQRIASYATGGNVAGVFVKDLTSGQELALNSDVAFSGLGWLRIALVVEAYRAAGGADNATLLQQLATVISDGNAQSANDVLRALGQGDAQAGVNQLNATLKRMGLVSTFLAQPYGETAAPPQFITPGNARLDANTAPDPNAQSTPAEVALLLEMLEQCRSGGGALPLIFPDAFNAARCEQVLQTLGQNSANILLAAGSGGSAVAHRQSWDANNHGDVALVRTANATYVVAVMLHSAAPLNWADTSLVISDVGRAVYGYFNNGQVPPQAPALNAPPPQ